MPTLKDQLDLEEDLVLQGIRIYNKSVNDAKSQGREADTMYGQRLLSGLLEPVVNELNSIMDGKARKYGKYRPLIKDLDRNVVAYIALKTVLHNLSSTRTTTTVAKDIGTMIEDEYKFGNFQEVNKEYYEALMNDFNKRGTKSYRHIRNALNVTSKKKGFSWVDWDKETRIKIGSMLLDVIINATDLVDIRTKKHKRGFMYTVVPSVNLLEWVDKFNSIAELMSPYTKPCVVPPDDWVDVNNGGYWSERMRERNPFVIGVNEAKKDFISKHDLQEVFDAVNNLQRVPWEVNTRVLNTMQQVWASGLEVGLPNQQPIDIPKFRLDIDPKDMDEETKAEFIKWKGEVATLYTEETSRVSKAYNVVRVIAMAEQYKNDPLYFVYRCDFRGRIYASSAGLNPQGSDFNKALLRFNNKKKLGSRGLYWLAVHGANCYGKDKCSFDDRVQWINSNIDLIKRVNSDPVGCTEFWGNADKPFQFLAFCFEYANAYNNPDEWYTQLPVGMDGSCNGLQHLSALLRDKIGGEATNLTPMDTPQDIYQKVSDRALELVKQSEPCTERSQWLDFANKHNGIPRVISKRSVMTLPYGCTKYSCFQFVWDAVMDLDKDFFPDVNRAVNYFRYLLWDAIGDVVVAARHTMDWLQSIAKLMSTKDMAVWWVNPVGFPVYQEIRKRKTKRVRSCLLGGIFISIGEDTSSIDSKKQVQGIVPNFVHNMDSAHEVKTVNEACSLGITDLAVVHDDFGTHACDIDNFRDIIREQFVSMYQQHDPLQDLYESCSIVINQGLLDNIPDRGDLDIKDVLRSEYFFS